MAAAGLKNRNDAKREGHLLILIWLGLALSLVGLILVTVFGLIWTGAKPALRDWGFRIGIGLLIVGFSLTVAGL